MIKQNNITAVVLFNSRYIYAANEINAGIIIKYPRLFYKNNFENDFKNKIKEDVLWR